MAVLPSRTLNRQRNRILLWLVVLSATAWGILLWQARVMGSQSMGLTMGMDAALFLAVWVAMMVAMMFPAAAPMVLTFARIQEGKRRHGQVAVPTWLFTGTYLLLWTAVGVLAYIAAIGAQQLGDHWRWVAINGPRLGGILLIVAGIYQLTPLKRACLAKCRSPLAFIMSSWQDGLRGAMRMGFTHGLYCLGCCWLLFAILFPLGMMNIVALGLVTVLIFGEKSLPYGNRLAWAAAAVLIAYGALVLVTPGILPVQGPQQMQM